MYFYIFPKINKHYTYLSFYSSLLFIPLGFIVKDVSILPRLFGKLLICIGAISSFNHLRTYESPVKYNDIFRYIDIGLANILGLCIFFIFEKTLGSLLYYLCCFILYISIPLGFIHNKRLKTILHSIFHILIILYILFHVVYEDYNHDFIITRYYTG